MGRSKKSHRLQDDVEDEMKVFEMEDDNEGAIEEEKVGVKKRNEKTAEKAGKSRKTFKGDSDGSLKVNRLKFNPGTLGLFAVAEIHPTYLIVNFTRNTKGYIALDEKTEVYKHLEIGQLIIASVITQGTSQFNVNTTGNQNKKVQLSIAPEALSKSLSADNLTSHMLV